MRTGCHDDRFGQVRRWYPLEHGVRGHRFSGDETGERHHQRTGRCHEPLRLHNLGFAIQGAGAPRRQWDSSILWVIAGPSQSLWAATKVSADLAKIHTGQNSLRIVFSPFSVYRG
jgi:hypothetical protein